MRVDFGNTAKDYAQYRQGFPESFFDRLTLYGIGRERQRVLDLGSGTGSMARGLAKLGCEVVGLDIAPQVLAESRKLDEKVPVSIRYVRGRAEETGLPENSFDVVTAGQAWHWFNSDKALKETKRVLVPGGTLVIAYFDWIPLPGNVVEATERLIEKHNPDWDMGGGTGMHPKWLRAAAMAGFHNIETFSYGLNATYSHEAWRGRIRASAGVGGSLEPDGVAAFDEELKGALADLFPEDPLAVKHRVFAVIAKAP